MSGGGAARYGDFDVVNEQTPQHMDNGAQSRPAKVYSCMARSWPRVFLVGSIIVVVLTFVAVIFDFITVVIKPATTMLNIYCLIFSLLAFSAEMRQFGWCRKIVYRWIRYVYFLAYYKPRGLFYVFFGLLLFGSSVLMYVAGAVAIVVGIIMLFTSVFADLPVYEDAQEERRIREEYTRYLESKANIPPAGAGIGAKIEHAFDNVTNKLGNKKGDQAQAGEQPPVAAPQEANTGAYQAPPVAQTAKAAPPTFQDAEPSDAEDEPNNGSAANRPPRRENGSSNTFRDTTAAVAVGGSAFAASGTNMFGSSAQTSTVARPLQEQGLVRGGAGHEEQSGAGTGESELRRAFNARMADPAEDLR